MAGGKQALLGATLIAVAAVVVIAILALGRDPAPAVAESFATQRPAHPPMRLATDAPVPERAAPGEGVASKPRKSKRPSINDLVTSEPVTVDPASSRIAVLSCGKSQGIALDGGIIAPPAPAQVVVTMLSRANPFPPYANSRRNYYVGVRNLDPVSPAQFRASLVCAKGIGIR